MGWLTPGRLCPEGLEAGGTTAVVPLEGWSTCPSVDDLDHRLLAKTAKQPKLQQRVPQELPLVAGALVHAVQLDSPPPKYEWDRLAAAPVILQKQQANSAQIIFSMIFSLENVPAAEAALIRLRRRFGTSQDWCASIVQPCQRLPGG